MSEEKVSNIKVFRVQNNKTQEEMAIIGRMSKPTYIEKEKKRVKFNVDEIKEYKTYFNLSYEEVWFLFFEN